jgi:cytochrome b pre-mRNA-processing protein 3
MAPTDLFTDRTPQGPPNGVRHQMGVRLVLDWLRTRSRKRRTAHDLYGSIVARSRSPAFYADLAVPDSVMGRLELIILHLALLIERLQADGDAGAGLAQEVAEAFVRDMDDSIREIGIGDMGVPRRVKQAAGALYERRREIAAVVAEHSGDPDTLRDAMTAFLGRVVWAGGPIDRNGARRLAEYVLELRSVFAANPFAALSEGRLDFSMATAGGVSREKEMRHG